MMYSFVVVAHTLQYLIFLAFVIIYTGEFVMYQVALNTSEGIKDVRYKDIKFCRKGVEALVKKKISELNGMLSKFKDFPVIMHVDPHQYPFAFMFESPCCVGESTNWSVGVPVRCPPSVRPSEADSEESEENEIEDDSQETQGNENQDDSQETQGNENEDDSQRTKSIEKNKENRNEETCCEGTEVNDNEDSGPSQRLTRSMKKRGEQGKPRESLKRR